MKLIIAEKPSVARDIARVVGATECVRKENITYYKGGGYAVANAMGHFLTLAKPAAYGLKTLPILPQKFSLIPIENHADRLKALIELMKSNEVSSLVCATDAGREGELIFRYIYYFSGCTKPFERLWISSLTDESILAGMNNLRPSAENDRIFQAGFARAKADWLIGMNLSRLYDAPVGRVQTPTLSMIAGRDSEIKGFTKTPFFRLTLPLTADYNSDDNCAVWFDSVSDTDCFSSKEKATAVKNRCEGKNAIVTKADTSRKSENRPLLYSLTSLQKEANEKHGFSAARTLVTMQNLYEKKLLTYPRTDSNYLTNDMKSICAEIVELLKFCELRQSEKLLSQGLTLDSRVINNAKVSDHHAIIPTKNIVGLAKTELTADEKTIVQMVIKRFLTSLDLPHIYNETHYVFNVNGETFRFVTRNSVSSGWFAFAGNEKENGIQLQLNYKLGDGFTAANLQLRECKTQPPKPFTESTLLSAMENISRRIDDKGKSELVKERGLGTPATRAGIIERLLKLGFIERKNKQILSTEAGQSLLTVLPADVKSVELTADIESLLSEIENGKTSETAAITEVMKLIQTAIDLGKGKTFIQNTSGKCPKCGCDVKEIKIGYVCTNSDKEKCGFALWKNDKFWTDKNKELTAKIVSCILENGKCLVKGLRAKNKDSTYDAYISLTEYTGNDGKARVGYKMEFEK